VAGAIVAFHPTVYRLENTVQHYDWGSHTDISGLLGTANSGQPEAELWLGAHPSAPSKASPWHQHPIPLVVDGQPARAADFSEASANPAAAASSSIPLDALIKQFPEQMLGTRVLDKFGPRLPYLFKVLAADRALSLQVHPASHQARAGFNRENREGIPVGAPQRTFHDANHKPEMVVAVTEFHALAGLRAPRVVLRMLDGLPGQIFEGIRAAVSQNPNATGLQAALTNLLSRRGDDALAQDLAEALVAVQQRLDQGSQYAVADQTAMDLAAQFPGDVGALASYLLNRVTLQPGEAVFLDDGEVHAYLKGLGVEIMANSDNVVRAGLTSKHVNVAALLECMSFHPKMPFHPEQFEVGEVSRAFTYKPPASEFALTMFDLHAGESLPILPSGPRIILVLDGEVTLTYGGATGLNSPGFVSSTSGRPMTNIIPQITGLPLTTVQLRRGDSLFLPDAIGPGQLTGPGQVACAWVP